MENYFFPTKEYSLSDEATTQPPSPNPQDPTITSTFEPENTAQNILSIPEINSVETLILGDLDQNSMDVDLTSIHFSPNGQSGYIRSGSSITVFPVADFSEQHTFDFSDTELGGLNEFNLYFNEWASDSTAIVAGNYANDIGWDSPVSIINLSGNTIDSILGMYFDDPRYFNDVVWSSNDTTFYLAYYDWLDNELDLYQYDRYLEHLDTYVITVLDSVWPTHVYPIDNGFIIVEQSTQGTQLTYYPTHGGGILRNIWVESPNIFFVCGISPDSEHALLIADILGERSGLFDLFLVNLVDGSIQNQFRMNSRQIATQLNELETMTADLSCIRSDDGQNLMFSA